MWFSYATFFVYFTSCFCHDGYEDTRIMARVYPTQKRIPFHRHIPILNAQKYIRSLPDDSKRNRRNHYHGGESYTVFPAILKVSKVTHFPDSSFFPLESLFDQKPNKIIKKVLPDYGLQHLRLKRSAVKANVTNKASKPKPKVYVKAPSAVELKSIKAKNKVTRKQSLGAKVNKSKSLSKRTSKAPAKQLKKQRKQVQLPKEPSNSIAKHHNKGVNKKAKNSQKAKKSLKKNLRSHRAKRNKISKSNVRNRGNAKKVMRKPVKSKTIKHPNQRPRKVNVERRLIAGRDAMIDEYPYAISIQKNWEHWCGGALLNPRLVITTANCVWKSTQTTRLKVRAGSRHSDRGGQVAKVQEMMRHPGWSLRNIPDNDVALLLLDRKIKFSNSVHSVDLPNRAMLPAFDDAWITSWGSDRRDGMYDRRDLSLQAYQARLMNHDKCNNITTRFGIYVTHNFFCMAQVGRRAPCTRDTGAPAVSDGVLWGLASWGLRKPCGTERFPAMFTYIASDSIMNFINNATRILMSDERFYPFPDRVRDEQIMALMDNRNATIY